MPAIAVEVLELTRDNNVDIAKVAALVSRDPAMAAKILKTANSSFYGCSQRVATISQAMMILGLNSVKTLVLGFSLVNNLSRGKAVGFDHRAYWKRSIFAATAARVLAARAGVAQQEEAFLAALLADVGMLVLDLTVGEDYGATTVRAASHEDLAAVEAADLGGTHAEVGGLIADKWRLPAMLSGPIAHHHDADLSIVADPTVRKITALVHLAGRVADVFVDANAAAALADVRRLLATVCRLTDDEAVDGLMADVAKRAGEAAGLFELNVTTEPDYETILERADEAMVELTLRNQQQATQLAVENQQLQVAATTDGLTGLANRAQFDAVLAERFKHAQATGSPLSLLLMDVDKFKSVNDRFGHPTGDAVLRAVAKVFRTAARPTDLASRYGGEEMCLVLPDTTRAAAAAVAESIRAALAARPLAVTGVPGGPVAAGTSAPPADAAGHGQRRRRLLRAGVPAAGAGPPAQGRRPGRLRRQEGRPQLRPRVHPCPRSPGPRDRGKWRVASGKSRVESGKSGVKSGTLPTPNSPLLLHPARTAGYAPPPTPMADPAAPTLNVCLIGQKFMGRAHSNAWLKVPRFFPGVPVTPVMHTVVARHAADLAAFADRWGWHRHTTDWRAAVTDPDVDLVDVTTPNNLHREFVVAAPVGRQARGVREAPGGDAGRRPGHAGRGGHRRG